MTLIYDKRNELGSKPGLHALIAGVSAYDHLPGGGSTAANNTFGMEQLTSPALSAYSIYQWLTESNVELPVPVATIRLLLSPSRQELQVQPLLATLGASKCTRDNFSTDAFEWRTDASRSSEDVTLFYFCGHGVQRRANDAVILFQDFGAPNGPALAKAAEIDNIYLGMAPPRDPTKTIAQNQLYLIDACRIRPKAFNATDWMNVPTLWDTESSVDNRTSPIFYAAIPGTEAIGRPAQMSYFCEALLNCLKGNGGDNLFDQASNGHRWQVTSLNLVRALKLELAEMNAKHGTSLNFEPGGANKEMTINYLPAPPELDLCIEINPGEAAHCSRLTVTEMKNNQKVGQFDPPLSPPHHVRIVSGVYDVSAQINPPTPPYKDASQFDMFTPLKRVINLRVI